MTLPLARDRMMKTRPGHGVEDWLLSPLSSSFVVLSEVTDGVYMDHTSDSTAVLILDWLCAMLCSTRCLFDSVVVEFEDVCLLADL